MPMTPLAGLDRTSPAFRTALDTFFITALPAFVTEANALETRLEGSRVDAAASVVSAQQQVTLVVGQVSLAAGQAIVSTTSAQTSQSFAGISAANANFKGAWAGLTGALSMPSSVLHNNRYWALLNSLTDVTTATPGVSASWALIQTGMSTTKLFFLSN